MFNKIFRLIFPAEKAAVIKEKYSIPDEISLKFRIKADGYVVVTSPDLPGFITQAKSIDGKELMDMINDAVLTYYDVPKKVGDIVYNRFNIEGFGSISYAAQPEKAFQSN